VIPRGVRAFLLFSSSFLLASSVSTYFWVLAAKPDFGMDAQNPALPVANPEMSKAFFPEEGFEFGRVLSGTTVEHDFIVRNTGSSPLLIQKVSMTTPLLATEVPREVTPGAEGRIHFRLETTNLTGKFDGAIVVFLNDATLPQASLSFTGQIVPPIELSPMPAFFVAGQRGHGGQAAIEIVNHESEPLRIEKIEHRTDRFTTQLETLKEGQLYRLILTLKPDGPGEKAADAILITTSSKRMPVLKVDANTYLYERVHTFPEVVAFGTLHVDDAGEAGLTLMIYQEGGKDFQVKLSTDIAALSLKWERGPKGDRYQAKVTLIAAKIPPGTIRGSIFVDTNDPQFSRLVVPVFGQIVTR
jgi:hypothetical protein